MYWMGRGRAGAVTLSVVIAAYAFTKLLGAAVGLPGALVVGVIVWLGYPLLAGPERGRPGDFGVPLPRDEGAPREEHDGASR
jgi:hypothetical protein